MPKITVQTADGQSVEVELTTEMLPKEIKDQLIQQATGLAYGNIDSKLETLGFKKNQGEKTSDFLSRVIAEQTEKVKTLEEKQPDLAKAEQTIAELKNEIKEAKNALKNKDIEFEGRLLRNEVEGLISSLIADITIPTHLTEQSDIDAYKAFQEKTIKSAFDTNYKVKKVEGKLQVLTSDGTIVENDDRDMASVVDVVKKDFGVFFKKPQSGGDGGAGGAGGAGKSGKPAPVGTKSKSYEESVSIAIKEGLVAGSSAFFARVNEINQANGIED